MGDSGLENGSKSPAEGIELFTRRPSVTANGRASEEGGNSAGKEGSLGNIWEFGNVVAPSSELTTSLPSSRNGPIDPASSPTSPLRKAVHLGTPRAFLTPKKPEAALWLEHRTTPSALTPPRARSATEHGLPQASDVPVGIPQSTSETVSFNDFLSDGPPDNHFSVRSRTALSNGQSNMTDISTPPRNTRDFSSDNLVRRANEKTSEEGPALRQTGRVRRYQRFENTQTTWYLGGRVMIGGDQPWSVLTTLIIILGITGVWIGTTGVWLWKHGKEYGLGKGGGIAIVVVLVYLFGLVISSFLAAALRDPGIIPRNLDPDPPLSQVDSWWEADIREIKVKGGKVTIKYCETCKTYRPPRASHCRLCGNCVDGIDHHCSYLHTCVGKRNYLAFLTLIISATISVIYIVAFSALHFALLCHYDGISFSSALKESPGAAVSFLLGVLMLPGVSFLLWYHLRLLIFNLTTVEQIRASATRKWYAACTRPDNPFAGKNLRSNMLMASLGRPQFPSWVDASGWYEEDKREVNPALIDPRGHRQGLGTTNRSQE